MQAGIPAAQNAQAIENLGATQSQMAGVAASSAAGSLNSMGISTAPGTPADNALGISQNQNNEGF